MNIYEKLSEIQAELKAPKNQFNSFGNYKYRNCEDILEAVKPICKKHKAVLILTDNIVTMPCETHIKEPQVTKITGYDESGKKRVEEVFSEIAYDSSAHFYIESIARLIDCVDGATIEVKAYAREEEKKKGMDGSQVTGASSSYARKYALNGLFNIDDTKDSDTTNTHGKEEKPKAAKKADQKPAPQSEPPKQEMSLAEALQRRTKNGTPFEELADDNLEWIIEHAKNPDSITAARIVLNDRKTLNDLQPIDDYEQEGDLPF